MGHQRRKVIVVTDGDQVAQEALEQVAKRIHGRVISLSAGNPTHLSGPELVKLIHRAKYDPVIVMFDDCGNAKEGFGERALRYVANHESIEVIGAIAVASNCMKSRGTPVHMALDCHGNVISHPVDKYGKPHYNEELRIYGDTVEILNAIQIPIIIGIGDVGKMRRYDYYKIGAPVTTKAIKLLLDIYNKNTGIDLIQRKSNS
ncbi:stage V sporulation protein AE [Croceifilum oryzae]|uniref:Stage V sporulation protein AE n=1 Tax=Croceifilum oryzae TaxID=1553429 RepID=A0AAJ1WR22_9BACL|nr:stage V sporulation protein AE [Croceifilum oryzae]MDQ0418107.1 stage V sporulation protein AE [Croceifilum oryzae]